jgi:hypothetical protein
MQKYNFVKLGSLTLRDEHRLRVFEHYVLRRDKVTGGSRKLFEELRNLYFVPGLMRMIK